LRILTGGGGAACCGVDDSAVRAMTHTRDSRRFGIIHLAQKKEPRV
jgi:hypothetical protein